MHGNASCFAEPQRLQPSPARYLLFYHARGSLPASSPLNPQTTLSATHLGPRRGGGGLRCSHCRRLARLCAPLDLHGQVAPALLACQHVLRAAGQQQSSSAGPTGPQQKHAVQAPQRHSKSTQPLKSLSLLPFRQASAEHTVGAPSPCTAGLRRKLLRQAEAGMARASARLLLQLVSAPRIATPTAESPRLHLQQSAPGPINSRTPYPVSPPWPRAAGCGGQSRHSGPPRPQIAHLPRMQPPDCAEPVFDRPQGSTAARSISLTHTHTHTRASAHTLPPHLCSWSELHTDGGERGPESCIPQPPLHLIHRLTTPPGGAHIHSKGQHAHAGSRTQPHLLAAGRAVGTWRSAATDASPLPAAQPP